MPLNRLLLILALVIVAAAMTVWLASIAAVAAGLPATGWRWTIPAMLVGFVTWRCLSGGLPRRKDARKAPTDK